MNYRIFLNGYRFSTYNDCIKLLIYSAEQSDYIVDIEGFEKTTPYSPAKNYILLKGSSKEIYSDIIIDFDNLLINANYDKAITISPSTLETSPLPDAVHYWMSIGAVFKIISDLSPAYVTAGNNSVRLYPPLNISSEDLLKGAEIFVSTIKELGK